MNMSDLDSEDDRGRLWEDSRWTDREMFDFAKGLQRYGFRDIKNVTKVVKTKSEEAVDALITREVSNMSKKMFGFRTWQGAGNFQSMKPKDGCAEGWSDLRKWQKIAQNQQTKVARKLDYSCMVIPDIWKRFHAEAQPPLDPEELDVPAIYNFIIECLHGRTPPHLPPKESANMLMLLQLVGDMIHGLDMKEEMEFAQKFKGATMFLANDDKIGRRRKRKRVSESDEPPPADAVRVPRTEHILLKHHRRLVQSFNPLTLPPWLLQKNQKQLYSMFHDGNDEASAT